MLRRYNAITSIVKYTCTVQGGTQMLPKNLFLAEEKVLELSISIWLRARLKERCKTSTRYYDRSQYTA